MMNREERRNIAKLVIKTDNMYYMGLDVPYNQRIDVYMDDVPWANIERMSEEEISILSARLGMSDERPVYTASPNGFTFRVDENQNGNADLSGHVITTDDSEVIRTIKESGMIENPLLFKRWVCAQTFRMLNYEGESGKGWDAYMKDVLTYRYQFTMLYDEVRRLSKMEKDHGHDFEVEAKFWTFNDIYAIYMDNMDKVEKLMKDQILAANRRGRRNCIYGLNGKFFYWIERNYWDIVKFANEFRDKIEKFKEAKTYSDVLAVMETLKDMPVMPYGSRKCALWKSIYRGYGGFYTLYNLFGWHGITIGGKTMEESISYIEQLIDGEFFNEPWKFHYLLKEVIDKNNFSLSDSIRKINRLKIS